MLYRCGFRPPSINVYLLWDIWTNNVTKLAALVLTEYINLGSTRLTPVALKKVVASVALSGLPALLVRDYSLLL